MIVSVISQKGGVSKSTIATNLAAAAHLARKRAVVVDLDTQGTVSRWQTERGTGSPLEGLDVIRPKGLKDSPGEWLVGWLVDTARPYEFVAVDCPGELCPVLEYAATAADVVLLPARPGAADLWAMDETIQTKIKKADQRRARQGRSPVPRLAVVTFAVENTKNKREAPEALAPFGDVAEAILHQRQVYTDALGMGESVLTLDPDGAASEEIRLLYRETMRAASTVQARRKA